MTEEIGKIHPIIGYVQGTRMPDGSLPEGWSSEDLVPLKPSADHEWQGDVWIFAPKPPPTQEARASMLELTNRQFKLLLIKNKHPQSKMVATIAAIDDELMRDEYEINWSSQPYFSRVDPLVIMATQVYDLTDETMDLYWPEGHKL